MTVQKDLKSLIRQRMEKTGEKYAAARANVVGAKPSTVPGGDGTDYWRTLRALLKGLERLVADLEGNRVFTPAPPKEDAFDPETGSPMLNETWRLELVSTVQLLARHLHLTSETEYLHGRKEFDWVGPETIGKTSWVSLARQFRDVARTQLSNYDGA